MQESVEVPDPPEMLVEDSVQERLVELVVTERATVPVKLFTGVTVMVDVPAVPVLVVTLVGLAEIVKSGGAVTLKSTETEWDREPLMPVTVTVTTPVAVKAHDSVEEPEPPVTVTGVNEQAELSAVSATSPTNPLTGETVIEEVPGEPTVVVTVAGVAMMVKSARPVTVKSTAAE